MYSQGSVGVDQPDAIRDRRLELGSLVEVFDAVAAVNDQLLVAISRSAQLNELSFPLPVALKSACAQLPEPTRRDASRCGVLLADAGFNDAGQWRGINPNPDPEWDLRTVAPRHWLSSDSSVVLTYSVLMIGWYVVHHAPALPGVLLGMSDAVVTQFRAVGVGELGGIAQRRSHWVQPRWSNRADVWTQILKLDRQSDSARDCRVLRCLKVSAGASERLLASLESSC